MEVRMRIEQNNFINREGKKVDYISYTALISGEEIAFEPRDSDRKLLKHLLKGCDLGENESAKDKEADEAESEAEKIPF